MSSVNSSSGTASNPSRMRMMTLSIHPPAVPATTPITLPAPTPRSVAPIPKKTVDGAPFKRRDSRSRPN